MSHPRFFQTCLRASLLTTLTLSIALSGTTVRAESPKPVFDFERLLNNKMFWDTGAFMLEDLVMAFAPKTSTTEIILLNDKREVVQRQTAFDGYNSGPDGAWATVRPRPDQFQLETPGIYQLVFMIDGQPATRFPFRLVQTSAGDDPFNPDKTYAFDGYWKRLATVRLQEYDFKRKGKWPIFTVWTGQLDLPDGETQDRFDTDLLHNGKLVAHASRKQGHTAKEHYRKKQIKLLQPHEPKDLVAAGAFLLEDYKDGDYELRLTRRSDKKVFRNYRFKVAGGEIQHLERSTLGFEPTVDYLMPRGKKSGSQHLFKREEIIWIFSPPAA